MSEHVESFVITQRNESSSTCCFCLSDGEVFLFTFCVLGQAAVDFSAIINGKKIKG